ncbi:MAG: hypothetical protein HGB34_03465 [Candidatus Moranbacteria bacterium]|nr:hypothetical protein [Candidatus Moranbacteria bacterium]
MIREYGSVVLVSCSLGTQIALLSGGLVRIDRIISLCGVYGHNTIPFPFIDIRSVDDHFGNLCHAFLNVFSSRSNTIGTVLLESIRHDQFGLDTTISSGSFREHRISEIIEHFLA